MAGERVRDHVALALDARSVLWWRNARIRERGPSSCATARGEDRHAGRPHKETCQTLRPTAAQVVTDSLHPVDYLDASKWAQSAVKPVVAGPVNTCGTTRR